MTTPAGWYDDPQDPNSQRYWDGQNWTPHRARKLVAGPTPQPVGPPPPGHQPQWLPPGQPPGGVARPRSRTPLVIAIAAAVVGAVVVIIVVVALLFAGGKTIVPDKAAKILTHGVSQQTGFTPTDVSCPSGVKAKVGTTFDCHFTGPDGRYTAHMTVTKVDGDYAEFDAKWSVDNG